MNGKKAKAIRKAVYGSGGASRNPGEYVHFKNDIGKKVGACKYDGNYATVYCKGARSKYQALKKAVKLQGRMVGGAGQGRGGKNKKAGAMSEIQLIGRRLGVGGGKKGMGVVKFLRKVADRFEAAGRRAAEKVGPAVGAGAGRPAGRIIERPMDG